jgi:glucose-1-phosphate thymidylyltransferase
VVQKAKALKPSPRNELEITDLNNIYVKENRIQCEILKRGSAWIDVGTPKSLMKAARFVESIEDMQSLKLSCVEEMAYRMSLITKEQFIQNIQVYSKGSDYRAYLENILAEDDSL